MVGVVPKLPLPFLVSAPILASTETHTPQSHRGLTRQHKNIPMHTAHRLVIEDSEGPEVTLQVLSDSLLQVTLRSKLYLSLQRWVCAGWVCAGWVCAGRVCAGWVCAFSPPLAAPGSLLRKASKSLLPVSP